MGEGWSGGQAPRAGPMTDAALRAPARAGSQRFRLPWTETLKHAVPILAAAIVLLPFYVMVSSSPKSPSGIGQGTGGRFGTKVPVRDDFCVGLGGTAARRPTAWRTPPPTTARPCSGTRRSSATMMNGVIVAVSIFVTHALVALLCAYALAKLRFSGREAVFGLVLFCLLIPVHAIAVPLYVMLAKLGLTNSYAAPIIP